MGSWSRIAFNRFVWIGNEQVYIRFGEDDVLTMKPERVHGDSEYDLEVAGFTSTSLAARIMSAPSDIRVRFAGPEGQEDFTIKHGVAAALVEGFGKICYPQ